MNLAVVAATKLKISRKTFVSLLFRDIKMKTETRTAIKFFPYLCAVYLYFLFFFSFYSLSLYCWNSSIIKSARSLQVFIANNLLQSVSIYSQRFFFLFAEKKHSDSSYINVIIVDARRRWRHNRLNYRAEREKERERKRGNPLEIDFAQSTRSRIRKRLYYLTIIFSSNSHKKKKTKLLISANLARNQQECTQKARSRMCNCGEKEVKRTDKISTALRAREKKSQKK